MKESDFEIQELIVMDSQDGYKKTTVLRIKKRDNHV